MGLDAVLELEQDSPADANLQIDYDQWGSHPIEGGQTFVHWGGTPVRDAAARGNVNSERAQLRDWEAYHLSGEWIGIAYDWAIGNSGTLYRLRGQARSGATSGDVDSDGLSNNLEGDAVVCIIGEGQKPSADALATLRAFCEAMGRDVYGHREGRGSATACPGPDLMAWVQAYRDGTLDDTDDAGDDGPASKPTTAPGAKDWNKELLMKLGYHRRGDRRDIRVHKIQHLLALHGFYVKVDGWYGPKTERAVEEFQEKLRLLQDGITGPQTWEALLTR